MKKKGVAICIKKTDIALPESILKQMLDPRDHYYQDIHHHQYKKILKVQDGTV